MKTARKSQADTPVGSEFRYGLSTHLGKMMIATNPQAPVRCSRQMTIRASIQRVWTVLSNINHWAEWQSDIRQPKLNGPLQPGTSFDWKTGGAGIHSVLHTVNPYQQLGWSGKLYGMYAIHNWTLMPLPNGTIVIVEESMQGLLASLFKGAMNTMLRKGMEHWLELLKVECER